MNLRDVIPNAENSTNFDVVPESITEVGSTLENLKAAVCGETGASAKYAACAKAAKEQGLLAIQRFFLIDSLAMANFQKYTEVQAADAIEILPATMPKVIRKITAACRLPIIAGGLISDKEDILLALQNGAAAVSSTNQEVWTM